MFNLANGIEGQYKNKQVSCYQIGKNSYKVTVGETRTVVGGIENVKNFVKNQCR